METKFQTSFIPKKPVPGATIGMASGVPHKGIEVTSIYMTIAVILFIASLLSIAGAFVAKMYFTRNQEVYRQELAQREKEFNIDQISSLKAQSTKIILAKQLMNNHLSVSKIFNVISMLTAESVRFLSLEVAVPAGAPGPIQISLSGYGKDFMSVAFQSDVLNQLEKYNLRNVVRNPIITSPNLNQNGTVAFGFSAQVDPTSFLYSKSLTPVVEDTPPAQN